MTFKHELAQNNNQFKSYTVFKLNFNGVDIEFMTLKDVKAILLKENIQTGDKK